MWIVLPVLPVFIMHMPKHWVKGPTNVVLDSVHFLDNLCYLLISDALGEEWQLVREESQPLSYPESAASIHTNVT